MNTYKVRQNGGIKTLVFCFQIALLLSSAAALTSCFSRARTVLNAPAVIVDGHELSTQDFAERLALRLRGFDALYAKDEQNLARAKEDTVRGFILETLARDYAVKNHITVDKNEVDAEVDKIRGRYPDEFSFRRALTDENVSIDKWRSELEFTVLQKKIFDKITSSLPEPTEAELKAEYDPKKPEFNKPARVRLRQIVLEKEDDAKRILEELSNGGDLAKLAKKYSIAPEGSNGGDTGWIEKGTLEVFEPAFKMNVGTRSKVLKSPYGFHIYEVIKKEPEARLSFADAKAKIRARLMEARSQKAFTAWLEENIRKASVRRNDDLIRAIKVTTRGS